MKSVLRIQLLLLFCFLCIRLLAQTNCVDYDNRYPITTPSGQIHYWNPIWNFSNMSQNKVTGLDIGGNGMWRGLLEYLPNSYSLPANSTKKYPVIIFFHGYGAKGFGSATELCRMFKDRGGDSATYKAIPGQVERNPGLFTQTFGGETFEYIVISPQFSTYVRHNPADPSDVYASADDVENVIDYVENNYRIDPRRIYLTGLSNGANMITEYAGSSVARAKRVAAIMPVSLCSQLGHSSNTSQGIYAKNIGTAKLKTWFVFCETDNCGTGPALSVPNAWVDSIRQVPGSAVPRYTRLTASGASAATLYNCSDTLLHDAWSRAYDPNFKASYNYTASGALGANDGINKNMYEWFTEQLNDVLPVTLKTYTARLVNDEVEIEWATTDEKDNASFSIERAGPDQVFKLIGLIPGSRNFKGEKKYSFTDHSPLPDLSYYRLVQTDVDGKKNYFEIKKLVNRKEKTSAVFVSPNPFNSAVSAFVTLQRSQKIDVFVTDISGKIIQSSSGIFPKGMTELKIHLQELSKGIYFLKVTGDGLSITQKLVKR